MKNDDYDVAIIGGGLAGTATAYYLSRKADLSILILEKEADYAVHASGRNAGMLRQAVSSHLVAAATQETLRSLLRPPEDWRHPRCFRATGSLLLGPQGTLERLEKVLNEVGGEGRIFSKGSFPEKLSLLLGERLQQAGYEAALFTPFDGVVEVRALVENFLEAARERGVVWQCGREVTDLRHVSGRWRLNCHGEEFSARVVVNAAGAWAGQMYPEGYPGRPELQAFRRHLMISETLPKIDPQDPLIWDVEEEFYFRPEAGGLLLSPGDEDPHSSAEPETDPRAGEWLREKLIRRFPTLANVSRRQTWACLRTKTKSGPFLVEWDQRLPDFFWVAALGGHGVGLSVGIGNRAATQIAENFL